MVVVLFMFIYETLHMHVKELEVRHMDVVGTFLACWYFFQIMYTS